LVYVECRPVSKIPRPVKDNVRISQTSPPIPSWSTGKWKMPKNQRRSHHNLGFHRPLVRLVTVKQLLRS